MTTLQVFKAINAVQKALAKCGIIKDRRNTQQGYQFRGIDDVYNALSPLLAEHSLCILPRMLSRTCEERTTKAGGAMFYVVVEAEFDFISAEDGSKYTAKTYGEAMDSADKATNKAMSAAYKYAAFQAFAIPTEGDNDADSNTPPPLNAKPVKPSDSQNPKNNKQPEQLKQPEQITVEPEMVKDIRSAANLKSFLLIVEKFQQKKPADYPNIQELNKTWRTLKQKALEFNLEWDTHDKVFVTVNHNDTGTAATNKPENGKQTSATH